MQVPAKARSCKLRPSLDEWWWINQLHGSIYLAEHARNAGLEMDGNDTGIVWNCRMEFEFCTLSHWCQSARFPHIYVDFSLELLQLVTKFKLMSLRPLQFTWTSVGCITVSLGRGLPLHSLGISGPIRNLCHVKLLQTLRRCSSPGSPTDLNATNLKDQRGRMKVSYLQCGWI